MLYGSLQDDTRQVERRIRAMERALTSPHRSAFHPPLHARSEWEVTLGTLRAAAPMRLPPAVARRIPLARPLPPALPG
jgi:hypothetical protein